jgi:transaldolase
VGQILELAGCDLLTIAPNLLDELSRLEGALPRKLDPAAAASAPLERQHLDQETFRRLHAGDRMSSEKLAEGIRGFGKAIEALEKLLEERMQVLDGKMRAGHAASEFFRVYDLDGDGFITREEWGGSATVFAALDLNGDGRISPEELAAGLGGAHVLVSRGAAG